MARKPQVTRTLTTTEVEVMCISVHTGDTFTLKATLPRTYKSEKALLERAQEELETDSTKVCYIVTAQERTCLYRMTEEDFIKTAECVQIGQ